jgi:hypothetical protein
MFIFDNFLLQQRCEDAGTSIRSDSGRDCDMGNIAHMTYGSSQIRSRIVYLAVGIEVPVLPAKGMICVWACWFGWSGGTEVFGMMLQQWESAQDKDAH